MYLAGRSSRKTPLESRDRDSFLLFAQFLRHEHVRGENTEFGRSPLPKVSIVCYFFIAVTLIQAS